MNRSPRSTRRRIGIGHRRPMLTAALMAVALGAAACSSATASGDPATGHRPSSSSTLAGTTSTHPSTTTTTAAPTTTTAAPPPPTTGAPTTTTAAPPPPTTAAPSQGTHGAVGPITSPPLPAPGPGFVPGRVTAVGDSVMVDYETLLEQDVPGIAVTARVSRSWTAGEGVLSQLKASGQLGAVVVVGLATNGPVGAAQFNSMMTLLSGASRVVFVNAKVDRAWQTPNNAVLAAGVAHSPRAVLADWYSLATANPTWLYSTQTHLPIDGTGAAALAALVASEV